MENVISINEVYSKVYNLLKSLNKTTTYFDWKSYDDENDIPSITINGEKMKVAAITLRSKKTFSFFNGDLTCENVLASIDDVEYGEMYDLLADIYYEQNESWKLGDFECDFLGLKFE